MAKELEAIWHTLSWETLIDYHVPWPIVVHMQQETQDLFQQSPWQGKGAFFFDEVATFDLNVAHLQVTKVKPGLIEYWNLAIPDKAVQEGDLLVEANGV